MKETSAQKLFEETRDSYDQISGEFSASRARFWEELEFLKDHTTHDDHVIDIGCGNGRFSPLIKERHAKYTGIDYSEKLIAEARRLHPNEEFLVSDGKTIPFPPHSFDVAYSFAVLHHIPSRERRAQFIKEIARVLHPDGILVLTVWNLWRAKYFGRLLKTAFGKILGKNDLDIGDVLLTFGKEKRPRYLHAFTENELRALLEENGFSVQGLDIIARNSKEENLVVVARKVS